MQGTLKESIRGIRSCLQLHRLRAPLRSFWSHRHGTAHRDASLGAKVQTSKVETMGP